MRSYVWLAAVAVALTVLAGGIGWVLVPTKGLTWALIAIVPALLWAFLESASTGGSEAAAAIRRLHRIMIAVLSLFIVIDVASDLAMLRGLIGPEWDPITRRSRGLLTGAVLAVWGNHLPKVMSPWSLQGEPFDWQRVHRFVGIVFTLTGVALLVVWSSLPSDQARRAAMIIVQTAVVLGLGRKMLSVVRYSLRSGPSGVVSPPH